MKILCVADIHMGAGAAYSEDRLADQVKVLEQIVRVAYDQDVRLCLIAGDVFHRPRPTPATLLAFRWFTDAMAALEIPTIACLGNAGHDQEGVDRPCALDLFESRWFRVSRRPELITDFAGVSVATLPSVPVSRLVAQNDSVERGPVFDQAAEALLAVAYELKAQADYEPALPSGVRPKTILLAHWAISGAALPSGLSVDDLGEPILDMASLDHIGYDAIIAGHIHKPQFLNEPPNAPALYCGSPMVTDYGDAGVEHGCWIVDTEDPHGAHLIPLKDRPFVTVGVSIDDESFGWSLDSDQDVTDAVVRVKYKATEEQARRIDTAALKRSLLDAGAHRVFQISAEIIKADRARVQGVDENLEPAAALDAWIDANDVLDGEGLRELLARYTAAT